MRITTYSCKPATPLSHPHAKAQSQVREDLARALKNGVLTAQKAEGWGTELRIKFNLPIELVGDTWPAHRDIPVPAFARLDNRKRSNRRDGPHS